MEIILLEKVNKLGGLGSIVKVKDGYARNVLLPKKKARRATEKAIQEFQQRRAELEKVAAEVLSAAQTQHQRLNGLTVQLVQKSGVDGRLFGSVTPIDIAKALKEQGFEIDKIQIRLPDGPIKIVGDFTVQVALHADVVSEINVSVLGEHV